MFMIDYVAPEKADGAVKEVYSAFPEGIPVPVPVQLYSASPRYLLKQMAVAGDYMEDDAYSPGFLAALRYIGAAQSCFDACSAFNKQLLNSMGLAEEEIDALFTDPSKAFEAKEAALLSFVIKSINTPDEVTATDIAPVRDQGWTDQQIFEMTAYAAQMTTIGTVFRTFAEK